MKQTLLLSILSLLLSSSLASAQAPQKIAYQAVARNASGTVLPNQTVTLRFSLRNASSNGTIVYQETQTATTSNIGLFNVNIGEGTVSAGIFAGIDWSNGAMFMQVELDPQGGNAFIDMGTQQMLSVPYALYAGNGFGSVSNIGDTLFLGNGNYIIIHRISGANNGGAGTGITAHTCGAPNVHNPSKTYGSLTDQQGNVYKTILIGTQEWMAENLKTTIYRNGDAIANVTEDAQWANLTTGAWCSSIYDSQYDCPYGKLYNWYAVADSRNVCPTGWHVPTAAEWTTLISFSGNIASIFKSTGLQYWYDLVVINTNEVGFSGLAGAYRDYDGYFFGVLDYGLWWSSTASSQADALCRSMGSGFDAWSEFGLLQGSGLSVRCLRD
jgi:uncharacterized protein (TIGR02145 family)